ncbi:peptidylprolyl isomerase [Roseivirga pacifica]
MKRTLLVITILGALFNQGFSFQKKSKKDYIVTISTNYGEMQAILYDETPQHKENFLKLIEEGFYDSLLFHRVIDEFMIQGGDPNSKNAGANQRLGNGGPGYRVPAEINPQFFHKKGALSAARTGDRVNPERESSGSQFYIVEGEVHKREDIEGLPDAKIEEVAMELFRNNPEHELVKALREAYMEGGVDAIAKLAEERYKELEEATGRVIKLSEAQVEAYTTIGGAPFLDGQYTVFGQVIAGLDVIDKISEVETDRADRPIGDVRMFISVEYMRKKKITKKYGYVYP